MSEVPARLVGCPVVVLSIREARVTEESEADILRDELRALYLRSAAVHAVCDFRAVTFMSSAGLRAVFSLGRLVRERCGRLVLCNVPPAIAECFQIARLSNDPHGMNAVFPIQPTAAAAVALLCEHAWPS